jgi:hypothetical protein
MIVPSSSNVNAVQKEGVRNMSVLSTKARKELPRSEYAIPEKAPGSGSYPIPDKRHAQAALRLEHNASPSEQSRIEAAVHREFPTVGARYKSSDQK